MQLKSSNHRNGPRIPRPVDGPAVHRRKGPPVGGSLGRGAAWAVRAGSIWVGLLISLPSVSLAQAPLPTVGAAPSVPGVWTNVVQNVPAEQVVPHVREVLAAAGLPAEVLADRGQNAVVIRGHEVAQRLAAQAIAAVDLPVAAPVADVPVLLTYPVSMERLNAVATALQLELGQGRSNVRITGDQRTGQLLVMAPRDVQAQVAAALQAWELELAQIQKTSAVSTNDVRQAFQLRNSNWRHFEDAMQRLGGGRVAVTTHRNGELAEFQLVGFSGGRSTVEIDRRTNEVTVVAPPPLIGGWEKVINNLENGPRSPAEAVELVRLVNAEPARVQRALEHLRKLRDRPMAETLALRYSPLGPQTGRGQLVVQQPPQNGQEPTAEELLLLEQAEAAARAMAEAQQQAEQQTAPPDAVGEDETGLFGNVQIEFVPELGVIVVRGSKRDVQRVMDVIKQIEDQSTVTQPEVEVLILEHANSNAVATVVKELYEQVLAPRQGQVSISALDNPNALLLIGRREAVTGVVDLVKKLDIPAQLDSQLRVLRLKHASAINAEELLRQFFVDRPGTNTDSRPGLGTRVRVVADYRTNSLIVSAAPRDLAEVARFVEQIDVESIPAENELRVFKLRNALATDLQGVLQAAITGESSGGGGGGGGGPGGQGQAAQGGLADASGGRVTPPSTRLSILTVDDQGNRVIDSGILAGVVVAADPNVNALIVRAPSASMTLVGELIRQLDSAPGAESVIKVFQVENGDATSLAQTLQELFGLAVTAGQGNTGGLFGFNQAQLGLTSTGGGGDESSLIPLRFSVDVRTNSIIATGGETDLEVVESLLTRLDTEGFSTRMTEVIWLHNASALDVAAALQDFVQQQIQQFQNNALFNQQLGPFEQLERNVVVVAEPVTNSLVISVSPRFYDSIRRVIDQLDRRPAMVMIKVLLAEVELNDGFEWGGELGIQDSLLFDRGIASPPTSDPGFNFNGVGLPNANTDGRNTLAPRGVSNFGVNRVSDFFDYGGFVFSAASDSVNILLRTLQDSGRLEVLAAPKIMTLDNTEGFVQVGAVVPRPTGVTNNQNGTSVTTTDTDVGLILRVQPRVGPDGLIQMNIDATRSRVGPEEEGIPIGFANTDTGGVLDRQESNVIRSPQILTTRAQSVITAYDGQTVVYGGLITKERTQNSRRVPWISDIPIIGLFFRYDLEIERRTELLVVMTPKLVTSEADLEEIKISESGRMSWCLADVLEMYGNYGLSPGHGLWGPAVPPVIYPDLAPTIDDSPMHLDPQGMFDGSGGEMMMPDQAYPDGSQPAYQGQPVITEPLPPGYEVGAYDQQFQSGAVIAPAPVNPAPVGPAPTINDPLLNPPPSRAIPQQPFPPPQPDPRLRPPR